MAVPSSRATFKEFCLRRLGKPVIEINVDDDQVEDRIDEAIQFYIDYHYDGTTVQYYKKQITAADKSNGYIEIPENIIGVVDLFDIGDSHTNSSSLFNLQYQIMLNDVYTLTSTSMVPYYMAMEHIQLLEELLVGKQPIRYNRHDNKLYIDMNWDKVATGRYIIAKAYQVVDPDDYADAWKSNWLQKYTTALIKRQWGSNLTKFEGMQLPGGVTFNGAKIYDDANAEIERMEQEVIVNYGGIVHDMMG
jgi:hypothetical protein